MVERRAARRCPTSDDGFDRLDPVPDEIAYRRDWRSYRIFLSFGDLAGEVERRVLPAPEPPPNRG